MDQRRFVLFLTMSMAILLGWSAFVMPRINPPAPAAPDAVQEDQADNADPQGVDAGDEAEQAASDDPAAGENEPQPPDENDAPPTQDSDGIAENSTLRRTRDGEVPARTWTLGSLDPADQYAMQVKIPARGAAIESIRLNDPRYTELDEQPPEGEKPPLTVVGTHNGSLQTMQTSVEQLDKLLAEHIGPTASLNSVLWEVAPDQNGQPLLERDGRILRGITLRYITPDGKIEIRKHYRLFKTGDDPDDNIPEGTDPQAVAYRLAFDLTFRNLSQEATDLTYRLQGPVAVPLENVEHTRTFRSLKYGLLEDDQTVTGAIEARSETAQSIFEHDEENTLSKIKVERDVRYIGVDVQYFAALIIPGDDRTIAERLKNPQIAESLPMLVEAGREDESHSDISVVLQSSVVNVPPGEEVEHSYQLYAGPKRRELLEPIGASEVLDYGWFGPVIRAMLWLLHALHVYLLAPYWLAIILMTCMVRGALFPLSRKQALGAKKMKELQPKIAELRKKYGDDKEKMARAQMELFSKHNYNPFAGCLPVFFQLPIFIGLYQALNGSVDLRLASFLWIDNLAAPDALFRMPFHLPFLGSDFNLLPIVTVVLFIVQQKMFMPAPDPNDEQAVMQHKMMNYMMIFMGFLFYHVPAGLCLYFIASSLWGIGERKMLEYGVGTGGDSKPDSGDGGDDRSPGDDDGPKKKSFWNRMLEVADAAANAQAQAQQHGKADAGRSKSPVGGPPGKGGKRKSRR